MTPFRPSSDKNKDMTPFLRSRLSPVWLQYPDRSAPLV